MEEVNEISVEAEVDSITFTKETINNNENPEYFSIFQYDFTRELSSLEDTYIPNASEENFFKNAKWSPDGSCILTSTNDNVLRIFDLPRNALEIDDELELNSVLDCHAGETVYDFCWYPMMSSQDPDTCCFLSSSREHPIHLWDAYTGKVRCSYTIIDHRDEIVGPNALTFNLDGSRIYCGYKNMIKIFDLHRPGRDGQDIKTTPSRKSKEGQKGIISCLAFNPDRSGLYAAGSYSQTIGLYDESNNELCCILQGTENESIGDTIQVQFSRDGKYLFSSSRKDNYIRCWDIRNTGEILFKLERNGNTNQRLSFDLDITGSFLATGSLDGKMIVYDLVNLNSKGSPRKVLDRLAHDDAISAISFHPTFPLIASCSGQRKFKLIDGDKLENDQSITSDNSLKFWRAEGNYAWCYYNSEGEILIHPVTNPEGEENALKEENQETTNISNETSLNADIEIAEEQMNNSDTTI
ncbi:telomerase Cajal body protein 1-like [Rhizophagus clarus]|uniref:Telomerase Cajal body protein 1-like n=2 Tax=Rhizophagus clarus TaxID=94130 RepID=A0A8H3QWC6_9GLOM|nr:telomerase Cajal body protein 1-like [Rhizophagus clarus]